MWATSSSPAQQWGGLLSLTGIKEISYKKIYKNYPYTSNPDDGLKMERSTRETADTTGFVSHKCAKSTINFLNYVTETSSTLREYFWHLAYSPTHGFTPPLRVLPVLHFFSWSNGKLRLLYKFFGQILQGRLFHLLEKALSLLGEVGGSNPHPTNFRVSF